MGNLIEHTRARCEWYRKGTLDGVREKKCYNCGEKFKEMVVKGEPSHICGNCEIEEMRVK